MKIALLLALTFATTVATAQTFTKYVDNTQSNGQGFAYNITIKLTLLRMAAGSTLKTAANGTEYAVELIRIDVDKNKGWYQNGKWYSCTQLEGICNTKNFTSINLALDYNCSGKQIGTNSATLYNIGDKQTVSLEPKSVGGVSCTSPTASGIGFVSINNNENASKIALMVQKLNNGNSKNPMGNQTNTTQPQTTGIPTNSSGNDPLAHFETDTKVRTNPMVTSTNTGVTALDNFNKGYQQGQQIVNIATGLVDLFGPSPEKQARLAREEKLRLQQEAERERNAALAAEYRANKLRLVSDRKALIAKFTDGKTPLSYEVKDATEVFYFVYSYQANAIENDLPTIYISNVFSLVKYADGTWPFKATLLENIAKTNKGLDLVLSGYYLSKDEAEQQQQFFTTKASNCSFVINKINYESKKSSQTASGGLDYWGNPIKKEGQPSNSKTPTKSEAEKPKIKVDYWGNIIREKPTN